MIRQYHAPRHRPEPHCPGTIDVGAILYLQDRGRTVCRNPWIVEAWLPRECLWRFMRGGHLAVVRSLRTGERRRVADWLLLAASDAGLEVL
jgi:hypothetical protein